MNFKEGMQAAGIVGFFMVAVFFSLSEMDVNNAEQLYFERAAVVAQLQINASNVNAQAQQLRTHQQNLSDMLNTLIGLNDPLINNILVAGGVRVVDNKGNQIFPPTITVTDTVKGE